LGSRDAVREGTAVLALLMARFASHVLTTYALLFLLLTLGLTATDVTGEYCFSRIMWNHYFLNMIFRKNMEFATIDVFMSFL
jgi:hypothetical protein